MCFPGLPDTLTPNRRDLESTRRRDVFQFSHLLGVDFGTTPTTSKHLGRSRSRQLMVYHPTSNCFDVRPFTEPAKTGKRRQNLEGFRCLRIDQKVGKNKKRETKIKRALCSDRHKHWCETVMVTQFDTSRTRPSIRRE